MNKLCMIYFLKHSSFLLTHLNLRSTKLKKGNNFNINKNHYSYSLLHALFISHELYKI